MALKRRQVDVVEGIERILICCRHRLTAPLLPLILQLELGFVHAVEVGPTSNFVGNHMTQGAIDLVQAELGQRPSMAKRMQQAQNTVIRAPQPKLLEPVPGPPPRLLMDGTEAGDCMAVTVQAEEELGIGPVVVVPGQRPPDLTELRKAVRRQRRP